MNLFRSEEHVRNWSGFKANTDAGINKLSDVAGLFSGNFFTRRLDPDYASRMQDYLMELIGVLKKKLIEIPFYFSDRINRMDRI